MFMLFSPAVGGAKYTAVSKVRLDFMCVVSLNSIFVKLSSAAEVKFYGFEWV